MALNSDEVLTANMFEKIRRVLKPAKPADLSRLKSYLIVFHHHKFPESLQSS